MAVHPFIFMGAGPCLACNGWETGVHLGHPSGLTSFYHKCFREGEWVLSEIWQDEVALLTKIKSIFPIEHCFKETPVDRPYSSISGPDPCDFHITVFWASVILQTCIKCPHAYPTWSLLRHSYFLQLRRNLNFAFSSTFFTIILCSPRCNLT